MNIKKYITVIGLVSFTLIQANSAEDETLNKFIGNEAVKTSKKTVSVVPSATKTSEIIVYQAKPSKRIKKTYNKKSKTYFINYDRPNYIEIDKYKNFNKGDLSKDYKKQMDLEIVKKDTL